MILKEAMSFINGANSFNTMISKDIGQRSYAADYQSPKELMALPKCEHIEETLVVGEEIIVDENMEINQQASESSSYEAKDNSMYFDEGLGMTEKPATHYPESCSNVSINIIKEDWCTDSNETNKESLMLSDMEDEKSKITCTENACEEQDEDEETIATFVTATGQQLALYAVEDSEEIFAVAVYDESGEPPTNFQFLMKADVERLIGEGAVRTVKKPTQMKRQLLTNQTLMLSSKEDVMQSIDEEIMSKEKQQLQQEDATWDENPSAMRVPDIGSKEDSNTYIPSDDGPNVTYVMMDNSAETDQTETNYNDEESDTEFIEQSTVQYILFEADQSDSELTFDEIQATLQNLKAAESKRSASRKSSKEQSSSSKVRNFGVNHCEGSKQFSETVPVSSGNYDYMRQNSNCNMSRQDTTAAEKKFIDDRQELINTLEDSTSSDTVSNTIQHNLNGSLECPSSESVPPQLKVKRPRKQQLISVNRGDSEIIIQPASVFTEEDNTKKKGKRKRKVGAHPKYHPKPTETKRRKKRKRKEVEVIEIDVDEEERNRNVIEITIDDNKDKYSSDKENEIIMVRDSDEESQQANAKSSTTVLQCKHCSRNFRQQRALDTHLRVCSKSPSTVVKLNGQKLKQRNRISQKSIKKEYACKICQEKFDVAVALARHVRSAHSQRKKRRYSKSSDEEEEEEDDEEMEEFFPVNATKRQIEMISKDKRQSKRNLRSSRLWEVKKLNCSDCGKWFPSTALLKAHCLQHGIKTTERQLRKCQVCKKLIKSRLQFVRHLKLHSKSGNQNVKPVTNVLQKKLRATKQVPRKIMTLRKRGRSKKL